MDYSQPLDLYCERTDALFWSEPLNALSNAGFLIAAWLLLRRARVTTGDTSWDIGVLAALMALVGVGSFVFHTVATRWASLLDVLFIEIFIYVYLARYLQRIGRLRWPWMIVVLLLFAAFERGLTAQFEPGALNGSYRYLPALAALIGMSLYAQLKSPASATALWSAVALLCVAIACRTVDMAICEANAFGTHFLWHLLTAAVLYCAASALLGRLPARAAAPSI